MDIPEKLATRRRKTKQNPIQHVFDKQTNKQTNTDNVIKTFNKHNQFYAKHNS